MLKRTPLYTEEYQLGARFTEFAGWELALSYTSIIQESMAVRMAAGLFDVSHLGKIEIRGSGATEFLQYVATADIAKLPIGKGAYTLFCNQSGGILDDEIIYRFGDNDYYTVPNAARKNAILTWFKKYGSPRVELYDRTDELCLLALQGPNSPDILRDVYKEDPSTYKRYTAKTIKIDGHNFTIMRSGYTGEEGYEIMCDPAAAKHAWTILIAAGAKPAGLGARDTLRLEVGLPLYGNDITEETTPLEAGLQRFVSFDKGDFVGRDALERQLHTGIQKKLTGFIVNHGIARKGDTMLDNTGNEIGTVTSGGYSPILKQGIGLAYVKEPIWEPGAPVRIKSRDKLLEAYLAERPFIKITRQGGPYSKVS
ncbi:MAG: glycine cleavage system aminomethyltransferase GcvT [Candidatus Aquicultor sp.]